MTARTNTALSLFAFGLLTSTSFSQPAHAAVSQATTSWAINRVASATAGSYCTTTQKYTDNTILTLAKSEAGEYSLAFDFARPHFTTAQPLTATVKTGDGSSLTTDITPQSNKVLVIGIGKNDSFISSLKSSGKLDLKANGQTFDFVTSNVSSALDELSNCATPGQVPALSSAMPLPVPAAVPSQMASAPAMPSAELTNLQNENAQLKQALVQARQTADLNNSQATMAAALQTKVALLQKQNEQLETQKDAAASAAQNLQSQSAQLSDLQKQNSDLKAQLSTVNQTVGQLQAQAVQSSASSNQVAILQKQNADMKAQLDAANQGAAALQAKFAQASAMASQPSPEEQKMIASLQSENSGLKQQLAAQGSASTSDIALKDLKNQLEIAQTENRTLKQQLDAMPAAGDQSQIKNSGNNWDLEQATRRYQESQREIRRLGALVEQQQTKCSQEKKDIEAQLFDPAITEKAQIAKLDELQGKIDQLEGRPHQSSNVQAAVTSSQQFASVQPTMQQPVQAVEKANLAVPRPVTSGTPVDVQSQIADSFGSQPTVVTQSTSQYMKPSAAYLAPAAGTASTAASAKPLLPAPSLYTSANSSNHFQSAADFGRMLKTAGINAHGGVQTIPGISNPTYSWKTDNLYGSAQQKAISSNDFDAAVSQYINTANSHCNGTFAATPAATNSTTKSEAFDISCLGPSSGTVASVLFTYGQGVLTTIAHEGKADSRILVSEAQKRMASQLDTITTASR